MDKQDVFNFIYGTCGFGMMGLFLAAVTCSAVWIRVLFAVVAVVGLATLAIDKLTSGD
jgi:hypothetical protein